MATTIPESIYWSSLDGCDHTLDLDYCILYFGWLRPYHIYIMYLRYQLYFSTQVFRLRSFSWTRSRKAFHPSLSLGPHALGGICYTAICHRPCNPHLAHWRVVSVTNKQCHALQIPSFHPFPWGQHSFCWSFPEQTPKNTCFFLGAGSPLCPCANEEN